MQDETVVDQWMRLFGIERQIDFAKLVGRSQPRVSHWRQDNMISASVILILQELANERGVSVPEHLLKRRPALAAALKGEAA